MTFQLFVFVLLSILMLFLAWLCCLSLLHRGLAHWRTGAVHPVVRRLLKPRTPRDCPACCLFSSFSAGAGPSPLPVLPWSEVKSRRRAPKRIDTQGLACPNLQCLYFGIIDPSIHALVGDGKHGQAEPIQTFRCQACRTTFSARRHTPLYRLKTPSHQIAMILSALAEGLDASAAEGVFGYRQATIITWLTRAGRHAELFHEHCFCHLHLPYLQLDHCCAPGCAAPNRSCGSGSVLARKRQLIFSSTLCDRDWPPFCVPLFTSDGLNLYFYALTAHFGRWLQMASLGRKILRWQVAEGLIYGQVKKSGCVAKTCNRMRRAWKIGSCSA